MQRKPLVSERLSAGCAQESSKAQSGSSHPPPTWIAIRWKDVKGLPAYVARYRKRKFSPVFDDRQFHFDAPGWGERIEALSLDAAHIGARDGTANAADDRRTVSPAAGRRSAARARCGLRGFRTPASFRRGYIAAEVFTRLIEFVNRKWLGWVVSTDVGFLLARGPDLDTAR
jgi:hypothetical protein